MTADLFLIAGVILIVGAVAVVSLVAALVAFLVLAGVVCIVVGLSLYDGKGLKWRS